MKIRVHVEIKVDEGSVEKARAIAEALKPDDEVPGLETLVSGEARNRILLYTVESSGGPTVILRVRNTLDDLLEKIELAERVLGG